MRSPPAAAARSTRWWTAGKGPSRATWSPTARASRRPRRATCGARTSRPVTHVGFFKSRRRGPSGAEIWTVVDGGQPDPSDTKRNIVQERTRTFTTEELEVQIPSRFATETKTQDGRTL